LKSMKKQGTVRKRGTYTGHKKKRQIPLTTQEVRGCKEKTANLLGLIEPSTRRKSILGQREKIKNRVALTRITK